MRNMEQKTSAAEALEELNAAREDAASDTGEFAPWDE